MEDFLADTDEEEEGADTVGAGPGGALSAATRQSTGATASTSTGRSTGAGAMPAGGAPLSSPARATARKPGDARRSLTLATGTSVGSSKSLLSLVSPGAASATGDGASAGISDADRVPVSTAELFEAENFVNVGKEWETLQTLKLVFERSGLDQDQQKRFLKALKEDSFRTGSYIVKQGDPADDGFYILTEGEVVITRNITPEEVASTPPSLVLAGVKGKEMIITHLYEGHFFGETALVQDVPRNANVRVMGGEVFCMVMSKAAFKPFLEQDPKFRKMIGELVMKKEETARRRAEMLKEQGGAVITPEEQRNEVKISKLNKKGRTSNGKTVINGYVLLRQLGRGSYGTVHLAMSLAHSKKYAIKVVSRSLLRKKRIGSAKSDEDVLREVAVMKRLAHPNVVALYEVIDDPSSGKFYMIQEFMELGQVMMENEFNQALPPLVARKYLRDMLCGLEYLHYQRVVHRDIKPSNLLIASDGTAKIADFGTATILAEGSDRITDVQGSPAFQPPEVFLLEKGQSYSGFAVDIWAVGATLHCMVVGSPPFMADNEMELVEKLRTQDFRLSTKVQLDPHLRNLLLRCLTKDPTKRITLKEIMNHDWVTEEGTKPLVTRPYKNLKLAETAVVGTPRSMGAGVPADGSSSSGGSPRAGAGGPDSLIGDGPLSPVAAGSPGGPTSPGSVGTAVGLSSPGLHESADGVSVSTVGFRPSEAGAGAVAGASAAASRTGAAAAGATAGGSAGKSAGLAVAAGAGATLAAQVSPRAAPPVVAIALNAEGAAGGKPGAPGTGAAATAPPAGVTPDKAAEGRAAGLPHTGSQTHMAAGGSGGSQGHKNSRGRSMYGAVSMARMDRGSVSSLLSTPPPLYRGPKAVSAYLEHATLSSSPANPRVISGSPALSNVPSQSVDSSNHEGSEAVVVPLAGPQGIDSFLSPTHTTSAATTETTAGTHSSHGAGGGPMPGGHPMLRGGTLSSSTGTGSIISGSNMHRTGSTRMIVRDRERRGVTGASLLLSASGAGSVATGLSMLHVAPLAGASPSVSRDDASLHSATNGTLTSKASYYHFQASAAAAQQQQDDMDDAQKAHLRALRLRQHKLLAEHTGLGDREKDILADQRRMVLHKDRASATVVEFAIDEEGHIADVSSAVSPHGSYATASTFNHHLRTSTRGGSRASGGASVASPGTFSDPSTDEGASIRHGSSVAGFSYQTSSTGARLPLGVRAGRRLSHPHPGAAAANAAAAAAAAAAHADALLSGRSAVSQASQDMAASFTQGSLRHTSSNRSMGGAGLAEGVMPMGALAMSRHRRRSSVGSSGAAGVDASAPGSSRTEFSPRPPLRPQAQPADGSGGPTGSRTPTSASSEGEGVVSPGRGLPGQVPPPLRDRQVSGYSSGPSSRGKRSSPSAIGGHGPRHLHLRGESTHTEGSEDMHSVSDDEGCDSDSDADASPPGSHCGSHAASGSLQTGGLGTGTTTETSPGGTRRVLSRPESEFKLNTGLQRVQNFLMVTADVENAAGGGAIVRKVMFRAKGKDGLSITGGRPNGRSSHGKGGAMKGGLKKSLKSEGSASAVAAPPSPSAAAGKPVSLSAKLLGRRAAALEADQAGGGGAIGLSSVSSNSASSSASSIPGSSAEAGKAAEPGGGKRLARKSVETEGAPPMETVAEDSEEEDESHASSATDSDSDDSSVDSDGADAYDDLVTVDDMTGNKISSGLGDLLGELTADKDKIDNDPDLLPLLPEEVKAWKARRAGGLGVTFRREPLTACAVAETAERALEAATLAAAGGHSDASSEFSDLDAEEMAAERQSRSSGAGTPGEGASPKKKAGAAAGKPAADPVRSLASPSTSTASSEADFGAVMALTGSDSEADDLLGAGSSQAAKADTASSGDIRAVALKPAPPLKEEQLWNAAFIGGRAVCCPVGHNPGLQLVYGSAESRGRRGMMEDRSVVVGDLNAAALELARVEQPYEGTVHAPELDLSKPNYALFAVFDGHNGIQTVETLSQAMHVRIATALQLVKEDGVIGSAGASSDPVAAMVSEAAARVLVETRSAGDITDIVVIKHGDSPAPSRVQGSGAGSQPMNLPAGVADSKSGSAQGSPPMLLPGQIAEGRTAEEGDALAAAREIASILQFGGSSAASRSTCLPAKPPAGANANGRRGSITPLVVGIASHSSSSESVGIASPERLLQPQAAQSAAGAGAGLAIRTPSTSGEAPQGGSGGVASAMVSPIGPLGVAAPLDDRSDSRALRAFAGTPAIRGGDAGQNRRRSAVCAGGLILASASAANSATPSAVASPCTSPEAVGSTASTSSDAIGLDVPVGGASAAPAAVAAKKAAEVTPAPTPAPAIASAPVAVAPARPPLHSAGKALSSPAAGTLPHGAAQLLMSPSQRRASQQHLPAQTGPTDLHEFQVLVDACLDMDDDILESILPNEVISGSTGIMLLVKATPPPRGAPKGTRPVITLFCANVGDSRAVLSRSGRKVDLSFDHKCTRPDERARILGVGGRIVKDRLFGVLAVSRAFGDAEYKKELGPECWQADLTADPLTAEPEVTHEPLSPEDEFVILACDGVWDVLTSQQAVNFVRRKLLEHGDVGRASRQLVMKAISVGSIDNVSAVVVAFTPPSLWRAAA